MKKNQLTIATVAALGLAAIACWFIAMLVAGIIEDRSKSDVQRFLGLNGMEWAEVHIDGLQVVLVGEAPDEAARFAALREAGRAVDAARLIDEMQVAVQEPIKPPKFSIEVLRNEQGIKLIGLVPNATGRTAVADRVARMVDGTEMADLLNEADFPKPAGWDVALEYGMLALGMLERSKISISANRVDISAISESAAQKRDLERDLRTAMPAGLEVHIDIGAPRPVVTPFTMRFMIDERGARFDACTTDNVAGRDRILTAARAAGATSATSCTIGLGVPSPEWDDAIITAIEALARLGGQSVTFSDADVTLIGPAGGDTDAFDRVVAKLKNDLPDVFSLDASLPEIIAETDENAPNAPPRFIATLDEAGQAQLRGAMADQRAADTATSLAKARFGAENVTEAMRLRDDIPQGWQPRVFAALEALALLDNGQATVDAGTFRVVGQTGDENASAEIARMLSDQLGTGAKFEIDVQYVEALDPLAHLPSPEECVEQIEAVLKVQKITFAPSSADIDEVARASIDNIAAIMANCEGVPMEVGGHTDSQGREVMNKELSQARADAVVNALLARRVLTSNLVAVGYGEEQPIADNDTEEGREANRRIEFRLITLEDLDAARGRMLASEANETEETGDPAPSPEEAEETADE